MSDKKTLVIASGNKGKIREIAAMLPEYNVCGCAELGFTQDIEENGTTFTENAFIKASTVAKALNLPALADDSGLSVDALNGAPGIYSARYAGDGNDEHNNDLLLKNLQGEEDRSAKFVCAMVFCLPNGKTVQSYGETAGVILTERQGTNGFGYDPIFMVGQTSYSEMSAEEKDAISHRGQALRLLGEEIAKMQF